MKNMVVSGIFDNLRSPQVRFLEEAAKLGRVHVRLWGDQAVAGITGSAPRFSELERLYLVQSLRYTGAVDIIHDVPDPDALPELSSGKPDAWVVDEASANAAREANCRRAGIEYHVIPADAVQGFSWQQPADLGAPSPNKKVLVTGCYDWFHSGHVRFFEEASAYGDLYVLVGNDANVRFLKGEGHPLFCQEERRYMVNAVRFVKLAMFTSGMGWMDAEPDIPVIKPDIYLVNEDGDKPEKREFSHAHNLEYVVLKRLPREGLPRRESTNLRGF